MNEDTYRMKNYELELQKQIELSRQWMWQRGVWIATCSMAVIALMYELSGKGFS
ncbi:MAG: hypothetical protein AAF098_13410 [Pseudomonadota bacterium]